MIQQETRCVVLCAGRLKGKPPEVSKNDFVIAVDGGYKHAKKAKIKPNLVIGDFDSLKKPPDLPASKIVRLPREKDETDLLAALNYGLEKGFKNFHIYGASGGRIDHTLAAVQNLAYLASKGARGYLYTKKTVVTAINKDLKLRGVRGIVSVFAHGGDALGVTLDGLKYKLKDAALSSGYPIGISNQPESEPVYIGLKSGTLIVAYPRGTKEE